jgi:predicted short-subunit dehydrogenase-like oxidoreductase (DUF2520 family)
MSKAVKSIVFIGSGNVATSLSLALQGEYKILQVYSKTLTHARKLARQLSCAYTNSLAHISLSADIYIIAVKDDAIETIAKQLRLTGKMVIHTSGSTSIQVLRKISINYGVLWPLYSFKGNTGLASKIPFFIEGSDKKTEQLLLTIVKMLKGKPFILNSEKRAKVHMAAVFTNNFTNHIYAIAEFMCKEVKVPFEVMYPIALETIENIKYHSPAQLQTGPAIRNDKKILNRQLKLLAAYPEYKAIYKAFSKSIGKRGRKKL